MSNFTDVSYLNSVFGNPRGEQNAPDWKKASKQLHLIQEELAELVEGIENHDVQEVRDAIADVLVTTYGMAHILGIDADEDMAAVQASNLSKLCKTTSEIEETIRFYEQEKGLQVYAGGELPEAYIKSACDQTGSDGKFYPAHKFLKSINWHEPKFR
ncbi:nucleoside triphosphate pyrophosphohydrolase family protein [Neptuniibacter sp. CAU 1671]|uniref:nucleoside triphosphate pyrophosphohydrolase family protein n=1 Tax=Neptuniibacter sp. CAU 1671 TaxID=3032593 RepID=UPI0023DB05EF|nr:nucleoside triphosphate pyrophosphohydrolase family protein [Neptuniibacter sp. CAU 1671]MDF2180893.1 nucleoside triphosphate pyrophosphohydrolase family protein [Neptuniibacter sp. CAU 1671]